MSDENTPENVHADATPDPEHAEPAPEVKAASEAELAEIAASMTDEELAEAERALREYSEAEQTDQPVESIPGESAVPDEQVHIDDPSEPNAEVVQVARAIPEPYFTMVSGEFEFSVVTVPEVGETPMTRIAAGSPQGTIAHLHFPYAFSDKIIAGMLACVEDYGRQTGDMRVAQKIRAAVAGIEIPEIVVPGQNGSTITSDQMRQRTD